MPKTSSNTSTGRFQTPEFREAARHFLTDGLWASERRLRMFRETMGAIWDDFKGDARYESLRRAMSDAAKGRRTR